MREPISRQLRSELEKTVIKARDVAEQAAREELQRLGVGDQIAADYLNEEQRDLRKRLRAHGRQLGDLRKPSGEQAIEKLVAEIAYEHWHRMLFALFLAENNLLMYEDGVTALAISDCFELAEEEIGDSSNGWRYAANYAAKMLPQIFRNDSPVFEIGFAPNHQKKLEQLLEGLDETTFQSQDSLGWVYQFWQTKRKAEINASEVKIGAGELSPVTQLFTEPYMVSFLLDNALGAWWANQQLTDQDYVTALSEAELRAKAAIDGVPLEYLRFIKTFTPEQQGLLDSEDAPEEKPEPLGLWEPAAGKFEQWPDDLGELKTLDPCCGSGHFLVSVFLMLVPLRMQREGLTAQQAIDAVLSQNIHGLELDQRCIEIAVFALALEAWRYPNSGGYRQLPELHLACSGLSVKAAKEEWKHLGLGKKNLSIALDWMHKEFSDAPVLGSLINPTKSSAANIVSWDDLSVSLNKALEQESGKTHQSEDERKKLEATVVAQGMAKAATMLARKYQWVVTNVPYLARGKQTRILQQFIERNHPAGKNDLATAFLDRCLDLCVEGGSASVVLPQNWLFLTSYSKFREKLLSRDIWNVLARLGSGAFDTISGEVVKAILIGITRSNYDALKEHFDHKIYGLDTSNMATADKKSKALRLSSAIPVSQRLQLLNPDCVFSLDNAVGSSRLADYAVTLAGIQVGDVNKLQFCFWELAWFEFDPMHRAEGGSDDFHGMSYVAPYNLGKGRLAFEASARLNNINHGVKSGFLVHRMSELKVNLYMGAHVHENGTLIVPKKSEDFSALYAFLTSEEFPKEIRRQNQKMSITPSFFRHALIDMDYWRSVSKGKYPNGTPSPYSNDSTQWIFHGHPCGSVIWDVETNWTAKADLRIDDTILQVTVARLLGYQWPAELDPDMELAEEQRELVEEAKGLLQFVDDDGIVCIPAVRGEKAADQRLEELLQAAYGDAWSTRTRNQLLECVGCKNKSLDAWLREKFFEQHCKLFQHRPFIWQIWDGLSDGFSALVNYHMLDEKNLERLIYTYLDDWIRTQSIGLSESIDGAAERLAAAENLKQRLELILHGEAPYDIFVRWKPIEEQPIGWNPDLNDGVRLNIRPFMSVPDVGKKGAGVLRAMPNIHWKKDRGKDVETAPWFKLGLEYDGKEGDRINDHHLSLEEKHRSRAG